MMAGDHIHSSGDSVPRFRVTPSASDLASALTSAGATIIESVLDSDCLATLNAELAPWFARAQAGEGPFLGRRTRRFSALFDRAPATMGLALWPEVLQAIEAVLGGSPTSPACDCIQLNLTQAVAIGPGEPAQALHRDATMFPIHADRELMINVMWALDDFTADNGATRLIPGSNHWAVDRRGHDAEGLAAEMPAGSALVWLGSTWHGGGENRTQHDRRGIIISYSLGWLAQAEKLLLSISPEKARAMPERLQRLIGYQVHRPNLGWVEGRDPLEWLYGGGSEQNRQGDGLVAPCDHMTDEMRSRIEAVLAQRAQPVLV